MKSKLYKSSKQFNTKYGQFGFYWHVEDLGLGMALDWNYGSFSLHFGPFYFLYVAGNFSDNQDEIEKDVLCVGDKCKKYTILNSGWWCNLAKEYIKKGDNCPIESLIENAENNLDELYTIQKEILGLQN
jgi:hypothetical protein